MVTGGGGAVVRLALVALATLAAVSATPAYAADGTISGRVTDASGDPLADVCVRLSDPNWRATRASATTTADGTYAVTAPAGTYVVMFADCGGRDLVTSFWRGAPTRYTATAVTVPDGGAVGGVDATLAQGGSMSGRVVSTTGGPVPRVRVDIRPAEASHRTIPEETDVDTGADGTWTAHGVPPGAYRIVFYPEEPDLAAVHYGDTADAGASPTVQVAAGEASTGVDATLPRAGSISGVVRDDAGQPHEGVCLVARPGRDSQALQKHATTEADGSYVLEKMTPGSYRIELSDCGGVSGPEWYADAVSYDTATPVVVGEGAAVVNADTTFTRPIYVAGTVRHVDGTPARHVLVKLYDAATGIDTARSTYTGDDGTYRIRGLRGTSYTLLFDGSGYDHLVARWWPGVAAKGEAVPLSFAAGTSLDGIDMTLPKGGWITGRITDAAGAGVSGLCIFAEGVRFTRTRVAAVTVGYYSFHGLDEGQYRLHYRSCGTTPGNWAPRWYGGTDQRDTADLLPVSLGTGTNGVDMTATPGGVIRGTVTDSAGAPLERICVQPASYDTGLHPGHVVTDAAGRYAVAGLMPDAGHHLEFFDCGAMTPRYVRVWNGGVRDRSDAQPLRMGAGEEIAGADVTMLRGGSFSGTVSEQSGRGVYGVCVDAYEGSKHRGTVFSSPYGTYSVGGLAPGTYRAVFRECGAGLVSGATYDAAIEVREAEDTPGVDARVTVKTSPTAPLAVTVVPGDRAATVSWQPPADDGHSPVTAYEVRHGATLVATTGGSARSTTVTGLDNGTTYTFAVNAVNAIGTGESSPAVAVRPRPPARLSVTAPTSVVSGSYASLTGRLTDPSGPALAGQRVDLYGRRRGSTAAMTRLSGATTSPTGSFTVGIRPAYPMEYAVRWAGSDTLLAASLTKVVPVSPRLTVSTSGRSVYVGVSPAAGGGRARLQVLRDTGWVSIRGIDVPSTGRVSFRAPSGGLYRVVVTRSGWATATSNRLRLA